MQLHYPAGTLRAWTYVNVVDIWGREQTRRVSLGVIHDIQLINAQEMVESVRKAQTLRSDNTVHATLTLSL
jgi:hypothetical protein